VKVRVVLDGLQRALLARSSLAALPEAIWKRTSALNTWGTNAIEGNTLSRGDVEALLLEEQVAAGAPVRDVLETLQHDRTFRSLARRLEEPVSVALARRLHEEVFRNVKPHAGQWRLVRVGIAGTAYVPPRPEELPGLLAAWEREHHQRDLRGADALALASWTHWRFEAVHPFQDGNGRVGRLLLNHFLLQKSWPPAHILPADRSAYTVALQAGHEGDLGPLQALLEAALARSLLDLLDQAGTKQDELQPLAELAERGPYDAKYLALRASQGLLPAMKDGREWRTSARALALYAEQHGRKDASPARPRS
jgi:cell filamentation protein, protein adenylyltransferase